MRRAVINSHENNKILLHEPRMKKKQTVAERRLEGEKTRNRVKKVEEKEEVGWAGRGVRGATKALGSTPSCQFLNHHQAVLNVRNLIRL